VLVIAATYKQMTFKILESVYFILKESIRIMNQRTIMQEISQALD
jgi:hypothetical protein